MEEVDTKAEEAEVEVGLPYETVTIELLPKIRELCSLLVNHVFDYSQK